MPAEVHETVIDELGSSLTAKVESSVAREERNGDHSTYTVSLTPDSGFLAEDPLEWSFSGEIERAVVVKALRSEEHTSELQSQR